MFVRFRAGVGVSVLVFLISEFGFLVLVLGVGSDFGFYSGFLNSGLLFFVFVDLIG